MVTRSGFSKPSCSKVQQQAWSRSSSPLFSPQFGSRRRFPLLRIVLVFVIAFSILRLKDILFYRFSPAPPTCSASGSNLQRYLGTKGSTAYTTSLVVGRFKDDEVGLKWLNRLNAVQNKHVYIVDDPSAPLHLDRNHGREAAVYLNYIIQNYHNLSDITYFWHTQETAWHNNLLLNWSSVHTINKMNRDNIITQGYVPSRCDQWPGCPTWIRYSPSRAEHSLDPHRLEAMYSPTLLGRFFRAEDDIEYFPPFFSGTCCSQFAVSRDTIRRNKRETYVEMLAWLNEEEDGMRAGMFFEYLWPFIFLRRGTLCPSMQDCYCKTYNLCVEDLTSIEQLTQWNDLRTRREEVKYQVLFAEEARELRQQAAEDRGATAKEVLRIEEHFEIELQRLEKDLEVLTNRTWNKREEIISEWKLGVPPTGW